jgi:hypothetical protein
MSAEMPQWRKARRSIGNGDCVQVAPVAGNVMVRDSKNPGGPALSYSARAWRTFTLETRQVTQQTPLVTVPR